MKTPFTWKKIHTHISYSLWKYVLLVVLAISGWSLIFTITEPQAPENKKVILGVYAYGDGTFIDLYMEQLRTELMPDMEEMSSIYIMPDELYGEMTIFTRVMTEECDLYVLPRDQFQKYAAEGTFMPLDEAIPGLLSELEAGGISLSRGSRTNENTGEKHQYAIPCSDLPGMTAMLQCDTSDMYISVFYETGNNENVLKFLEQFIHDMLEEPVAVEYPAA